MSDFTTRLRECLIEHAMSQHQLAIASDTTDVTISRILNEDRNPSLGTAIRIADALSVSLDWLCGREEYIT